MKKNNCLNIVIIIFLTSLIISCSDFLNTNNEKSIEVENSKITNAENLFGSDFNEPTTQSFSEKNLLLNIGLNVVLPSTNSFSDELQIFNIRLTNICKNTMLTPDELKKIVLPDWQRVIYNFHKMDSLSFGPISEKSKSTNLDLRTEFYSWPYSNFCTADKSAYDIHFKTQTQPTLPFNSKSLETVEYLIFSNLNVVKCNLTAQPHLQNWINLPEKLRLQSRCELAVRLTDELVSKSIQLKNQWNRTKGNYSKILVDESKYASFKIVLNEFSDALYSIESIKDQRLGIPLGKNKKECSTDICPDRTEHLYSDLALIAISARLDGFRNGFFGSKENLPTDHGLDDYLNQSGHADITLKIQNLLTTAENNLEKIKQNGGLNDQIQKMNIANCKSSTTADPLEPLCGFYEDIKLLTTTLKTEVLVALSLKSPPVYQGDND